MWTHWFLVAREFDESGLLWKRLSNVLLLTEFSLYDFRMDLCKDTFWRSHDLPSSSSLLKMMSVIDSVESVAPFGAQFLSNYERGGSGGTSTENKLSDLSRVVEKRSQLDYSERWACSPDSTNPDFGSPIVRAESCDGRPFELRCQSMRRGSDRPFCPVPPQCYHDLMSSFNHLSPGLCHCPYADIDNFSHALINAPPSHDFLKSRSSKSLLESASLGSCFSDPVKVVAPSLGCSRSFESHLSILQSFRKPLVSKSSLSSGEFLSRGISPLPETSPIHRIPNSDANSRSVNSLRTFDPTQLQSVGDRTIAPLHRNNLGAWSRSSVSFDRPLDFRRYRSDVPALSAVARVSGIVGIRLYFRFQNAFAVLRVSVNHFRTHSLRVWSDVCGIIKHLFVKNY